MQSTGIDDEPAFNWWAKDVLRLRWQRFEKVQTRHWSTASKCGIHLPKTVEEALEMDRETRTDFWAPKIRVLHQFILSVGHL